MNRLARRWIFALGAVGFAVTLLLAFSGLAPVGQGHSDYGDLVNRVTVAERHITDAVTAVNFDIRGFDTLGEEFILFTSVMGVVMLMRRQPDEPAGDHEDQAPNREVPSVSDAVRVTALLLIAPSVLFGLYVVAHGQLTPGGGFQGGVILSTAPLLLYLSSSYPQFRRAAPPRLVGVAEAFGAFLYIAVGVFGVLAGGLFLENRLPLDQLGSLTSGGIVPIIDIGVGLEVSGGLILILLVYLEELMEEKEQ